MQRVYRTVKTGIYYGCCYFLSLFIQTPPITFLVPSVVDQLESFICLSLKQHLVGLFEKQRTIDYYFLSWLFFIFVWVMLKEVKLFRGIVLSAPGTILGREKIKSLGRAAAARKKKPSVFRKNIPCMFLSNSVRTRLSFRNNCLSLFQFLPIPFFPLELSTDDTFPLSSDLLCW